MSTPALPPGWTQHSMNARTFYYHAATNTTQNERPSLPQEEQHHPQLHTQSTMHVSTSPCNGHGESEPATIGNNAIVTGVLVKTSTAEASASEATIISSRAPQEPLQSAAETRPGCYTASIHDGNALTSADQALDATIIQRPSQPLVGTVSRQPLASAVEVQPGCYSSGQSSRTLHPAPIALASSACTSMSPLPVNTREPIRRIPVRVPEPGLAPGQRIVCSVELAPNRAPTTVVGIAPHAIPSGSIITMELRDFQRRATNTEQSDVAIAGQLCCQWLLYGMGCGLLAYGLFPVAAGLIPIFPGYMSTFIPGTMLVWLVAMVSHCFFSCIRPPNWRHSRIFLLTMASFLMLALVFCCTVYSTGVLERPMKAWQRPHSRGTWFPSDGQQAPAPVMVAPSTDTIASVKPEHASFGKSATAATVTRAEPLII